MKWTVLLLNGLLQYQPAILTPLYPLAMELERAGFRVVVDNHLQTWHYDEEPVIVVGHSRGGGRALEFQKKQHEAARYVPLVITLDAAPAWPCPVPGKCVNIRTSLYPNVAKAENIPIERVSGGPILHVALANAEAAKRIVLARATKMLRSDYENHYASRRRMQHPVRVQQQRPSRSVRQDSGACSRRNGCTTTAPPPASAARRETSGAGGSVQSLHDGSVPPRVLAR